MTRVKEIELTYNKLQLLLNRKIKAMMKCGNCNKYFMTTIKRTDCKYVVCTHCKCVQETGIVVGDEEE